MATFDQLSPEQRAIVELVLRQGKTYNELSDMLNLPEGRVRELARDALVELAPVSVRGVEEDWRGQLADYVLGQQSGPEATATKGHLRRSEAARSWARSLLDSLEQFYENGSVPAIPEGERKAKRAEPVQKDRGSALAPATDPLMRRRLLAGGRGARAAAPHRARLAHRAADRRRRQQQCRGLSHARTAATNSRLLRASRAASRAASRPASPSSSSGTARSSCSCRPPTSRRAGRARATTCGSTTARTTPSRSAAR